MIATLAVRAALVAVPMTVTVMTVSVTVSMTMVTFVRAIVVAMGVMLMVAMVIKRTKGQQGGQWHNDVRLVGVVSLRRRDHQ